MFSIVVPGCEIPSGFLNVGDDYLIDASRTTFYADLRDARVPGTVTTKR